MFYSEGMLTNDIDTYLEKHTTSSNPLLQELKIFTQLETNMPNMLSGPIEGRFLAILIKILKPKKIIELGTFTGYSTLMMAESLCQDGKIITYESRKEHALIAQRYFDKSPHGHKITIKLQNALEGLKLESNDYDFAFIDADKNNYPNYFKIIYNLIKPGGVIIIDNALWKGKVINPSDKMSMSIDSTNKYIIEQANLDCVLLPIRDGLMMVRKNDL